MYLEYPGVSWSLKVPWKIGTSYLYPSIAWVRLMTPGASIALEDGYKRYKHLFLFKAKVLWRVPELRETRLGVGRFPREAPPDSRRRTLSQHPAARCLGGFAYGW